ncbi:hypothetical protein JGH11_09115 [Dysgonomonas sp. Marseille-P4677]|uniref:hypothetical protein n=1 Tax=Dysgonomonas sp. Marseille-P4677 TaxID=2364790 RepID=UPI0019129EC5|nr:hypothetical protein [Dysgonomonas sp. Marseille-P4677]MBK5721027.1 hypothetical protein [Dysgonomonas sp. Marseille-P4677]
MNKLFDVRNFFGVILLIGIIGFTQCSGGVDGQLKVIAKEANKQCPKNLDIFTRLDSCATFPDKHYKYYHTITGVEVTDTMLFKTQLLPQIVKTIKVTPDMRFFRENDVILEYQYNDDLGKYLFSIVAGPQDYKSK